MFGPLLRQWGRMLSSANVQATPSRASAPFHSLRLVKSWFVKPSAVTCMKKAVPFFPQHTFAQWFWRWKGWMVGRSDGRLRFSCHAAHDIPFFRMDTTAIFSLLNYDLSNNSSPGILLSFTGLPRCDNSSCVSIWINVGPPIMSSMLRILVFLIQNF